MYNVIHQIKSKIVVISMLQRLFVYLLLCLQAINFRTFTILSIILIIFFSYVQCYTQIKSKIVVILMLQRLFN